jgi:hypothetical protein
VIYDVKGRMVEVSGELFPAVNIQVWDWSPEVRSDPADDCFYGIYFELMFENGFGVVVSQEVADILNGHTECLCSTDNLDHFVVEVYGQTYNEVIHAYHCRSETELRKCLEAERRINSTPVSKEEAA